MRNKGRAKVLPQANRKPGRVLIPAWWVVVALLAAACRGSTSPASSEASPQLTATPSASDKGPRSGQASLPLSPGQRLRFERISLEQGLSQSTVFCMLQDSQGFMWFGTEDGLNKYDGYSFSVYKHDPEDPNSLSSSWISAVLEDASGMLWIGTSDGLDRYDVRVDQFTHYRNDPEDPSSLSDDEITVLYQDGEGVLWIGTGGGGLDRLVLSHGDASQSKAKGFNQENAQFVHYRHNPDDPNSLSSNAVSAIYQDSEGVLWVGTEDGGLNRFDRETDRWRRYVNDPGDPHSLNHDTITAISEDPSGALWVGMGGGGLDRFDRASERFIHYQHDPDDPQSLSSDDVAAVLPDRDGLLWIGTRDAGINWYDPEKQTFGHSQNVPGNPHSLSADLVLSIFQDREGGLWFGTIGGGVNKLNMGWRNFALYQNDPGNPNSLGDNMIRAFHQGDDGVLWVGTMFGGVDRLDRQTGTWRHYRHDPDDPGSLSADWVSAIHRDRSGALWIATASGLDRFNPETETFTHYLPDPDGPPGSPGNNVRTIGEDQEGELWIGTKGGLYRFDSARESWGEPYRHDPDDPHSLSEDWVFSFQQDREGRFWIGSLGGGLDRLDPEKGVSRHYKNDPEDPHSLSNNIALSIVQDQSGTLWIGTNGGVDKFEPETDTFIHYREKDGLASDSVYCMLEDGQGHLWVSTGKGLSRFDPRSETFVNYDVADGLQSNEFNSNACLVSDSGEMFFGGIDGFNAFYPDRVQDNLTVPPVVFTSLTQGGEELDLGIALESVSEVTLEWPDNAFEFEFAALSYAHPEKNQYAYYLEGFEETWNDVGTRRYGQYTNLPGGTYTLRVKGSNNDGVWNAVGTAIKITVVPPFWATWWFRGIVLLVVVGTAFGGYRLRVRRLEARGRELESQVNDRTQELAALNAVSAVVSHSLNLQEILSSALTKTLEVIRAEAGGIYLLQQDTQVLIIAAHEGLSAQFVAEIDNLKVGEGFSGQVAESGEPLVVQDLSTDPRLTRSAARESGFHALGIVPLLSRANVVGTLFVATRGRREFSPQDVELLAAIGAQIGVAAENARLYEQAQQVAAIQERDRLARNLHDSVTQTLFTMTLTTEAARLLFDQDPARAVLQLDKLQVLARSALAETRSLISALRPATITQQGLIPALRHHLALLKKQQGLNVTLDVTGEPHLAPEQAERLFRVIQEALNNVVKHAHTAKASVTLQFDDHHTFVQIEDEGKGFVPHDAQAKTGHIGLSTMRERVEMMGGTLTIDSRPGKGTRVTIQVPGAAESG